MKDDGSSLVYGMHPVLSALNSKKRRVRTVITNSAPRGRLKQSAQEAGAEVLVRSRRFLDRITGSACHQGVAAFLGGFEYGDMDGMGGLIEVLLSRGEVPLFVFLDCVQDPRNLGAVIRSTLELGGHAVVIPERGSAGVTPAAVKTSAGAAEVLPVFRVPNPTTALEYLERYGLTTVAAVEDGVVMEKADLSGPIVLVLGSEGTGIRRSIRKNCKTSVTIPVTGIIGSLNLSVAAGIILAETSRQRREKKHDQRP